MAEIIAAGDLANFLGHSVGPAQATTAIRVALGWLRSATRLTAWPDPLPEDLWAWGLELSAIAYTNPSGLQAQTVGEVTETMGYRRRNEILADAARAYAGAGSGPQFSFPPAPVWPA